MVKGNHERVCL